MVFTVVKEVEKIGEESDEQSKSPKLELDGEFELFVLNVQKLHQTVKIGKNLSIALRMKIVEVLVEYWDIFAWFSFDLGIVPRHIAEHKLGIPKGTKLIFLET